MTQELHIVGGGMAGVSTALGLAERGKTVALVEARRIGWGASGRNGGFVGAGFSRGLSALISRVGKEHALRLYRLSEMGVALVRKRADAIAGGVASMASAKITFFLGGSPEEIALARPVLDLLAERIFELGPIGAGMGTKVVNNGVMHAVMVVLIEAFAMSTKLGVPVQTMVDILNREEGLLRPLVHRVQERMADGNYTGGMSVSNARKDSVLALETAQNLGVPLFATLASHTPYEIAEAKGMGDLDYAALATLWEDWASVDFQKK